MLCFIFFTNKLNFSFVNFFVLPPNTLRWDHHRNLNLIMKRQHSSIIVPFFAPFFFSFMPFIPLVSYHITNTAYEIVNEPSVGLYYVQENIRRAVPANVESKVLFYILSLLLISKMLSLFLHLASSSRAQRTDES